MGSALWAELIKVEEKSDWKDYLPVLPVSNHEIVLSRYLFFGILLATTSVISLVLCSFASLIGGFSLFTMIPNLVLGIAAAFFMLLFGIPSGYFFKNELSAGAMIWAIFLFAIIRSVGADKLFFNAASPIIYIIAMLVLLILAYVSYRVSLWIYESKKYLRSKRKIESV